MKHRQTKPRLTPAMILEAQAPRRGETPILPGAPRTSKKLKILAQASADLNRSAAALGPSPTALCWKCRDIGIAMPPEWARVIKRERKAYGVLDKKKTARLFASGF
jgi:hypothetical protein